MSGDGAQENFIRYVRRALSWLPIYSSRAVSRHLMRQANAARDNQDFQSAATMYLSALRFHPDGYSVHVQRGHMLKEAGRFAEAEASYSQAEAMRPGNADLAMQMGHFFKVAGRIDEANLSYRRALDLRPGWKDAEAEIAATGGQDDTPELNNPDAFVPISSLEPRGRTARPAHARAYRVQIGHSRAFDRDIGLKQLAGIEAIRGYRITNLPLTELRVILDGKFFATTALSADRYFSPETGWNKFVFNLWLDFSHVSPGRHDLSLQLMAGPLREHSHNLQIYVADPHKASFEQSDTWVPISPDPQKDIRDYVNRLPSTIRSTARSSLAGPVKTILVQRIDQLGDFICSVPAILRLRDLFPEARIVGLVTRGNEQIARLSGILDAVEVAQFDDDPQEQRRTMTADQQRALSSRLAAYEFDLAIDLGEGSASRPVLLLSGARFLYGFKDREFPWLSAGFELSARDPLNRLETLAPSRKILAMVDALGALRAETVETGLANRPSVAALNELALVPGGYVVLHAGARLSFSRWHGFGALAEILLERTSLKVVLFAENDTEIPSLEDGRLIIVRGIIDFSTFDAILAHCAAFVGNDSGPKHLAAIRGAKVISLHLARLNWSEWGQDGDGLIISRRVPCAGCAIHDDAAECGQAFACLKHITVQEVYECLSNLLGTPDT